MPYTWRVSTIEAVGLNPEPIIEAANRIRNQDYKVKVEAIN
ncbi:MAG: hypothetical protein OXG97_03055 [Candidatus Poribacteria bacterium]|nr:hypothetical protein [Candidatus Poribacteria bacterium]